MKKLLIVGILISGICGSSISPITQPVAAGTLKQKSSPSITPTKIQVLNLGAEPRQKLRFTPMVNSKQTMIMSMDMSIDLKVGENSIPKTPIPKVLMKIDLNVRQVDPSGDIYYSFAYTDIKTIADKDTPPEMLAAMQKGLRSLVGIKGDITVSSSGEVKSKKLFLPKTLDPSMKSTLEQFDRSIDQLSNQFPQEMVGLGAKWRTDNTLQASGIKLNQSATYEIVKIDQTAMTIKTQVTQTSPPQNMVIPNMSKAKAKLLSLNSNGEGSYVVRFDSLLPITGNLDLKTDSQMSIQSSAKEEPINVVSKIGINMNFSNK